MATFTPGQDAQRLASSKLNVPRIGVRFRLPSDMNRVEYFGRGPGENYIDRNASSFVDLYRTTADQMYTNNYVRPQENGPPHRHPLGETDPQKAEKVINTRRQYHRFQCPAQFCRGL